MHVTRVDGASDATAGSPPDGTSQRLQGSPSWLVLEGASWGVLMALVLTTGNLFDVLIDDRISGVAAPTIHRFLATEYRSEVVRAVMELLSLSVVVGAAIGSVVAMSWVLHLHWSRRRRPAPWSRCAVLLGLWCWLAIWGYLYDVAVRPALHQTALFGQGGWRAALQIVVADWLGPAGVLLVGVATSLGLLLWPLIERAVRVRFWRVRFDSTRVSVKRWGAVLAAFGVVSAVGATAWLNAVAHVEARTDGPPNVLIIAADSLRPDRIDAVRAPNLAQLMERSTTFERAYTPLARTFPAWVSISTGQYPHHHGVRNMFPRWETRDREFDTLARRLRSQGYRTSVVGDFAADIFRRIDLGYEHVKTPTFTMRELVREHLLKNDPWLLAWVRGRFMRWLVPVLGEMSDATDPWAVTRDAIDEIAQRGDKPFFVTVFYSTTHFPYAAPGPYHRRFGDPRERGRFRYAKADTLGTSEVMTETDVAQVRALYDGAVFATDAAIGELLEALEKYGIRERTIVVITADHGEQLYESGRSQGHGDHLQGDEALLVPLAISDPKRPKGQRFRRPVSLVDLAPTLLEMTGSPPLRSPDGRSLASAISGEEPSPRPVYSETGLWFTELIAEVPLANRIAYPDLTQITEVDRAHADQIVIRARWEAITVAAKHRMIQLGDLRLLYFPTRSGPVFRLCDLAADPSCSEDRSREHPGTLELLKSHFWQAIESDPLVKRRGDYLLPREARGMDGDSARERP